VEQLTKAGIFNVVGLSSGFEDRSHVLRARKTDEGWAASFVSDGEQKLVAESRYLLKVEIPDLFLQ
jgi:hypothetical protein